MKGDAMRILSAPMDFPSVLAPLTLGRLGYSTSVSLAGTDLSTPALIFDKLAEILLASTLELCRKVRDLALTHSDHSKHPKNVCALHWHGPWASLWYSPINLHHKHPVLKEIIWNPTDLTFLAASTAAFSSKRVELKESKKGFMGLINQRHFPPPLFHILHRYSI